MAHIFTHIIRRSFSPLGFLVFIVFSLETCFSILNPKRALCSEGLIEMGEKNRHYTLEQMPLERKNHYEKNVKIHHAFRTTISQKAGSTFEKIARTFVNDGVLIFPGYLSLETTKSLNDFFALNIKDKKEDPFTKLTTFGATEDVDLLSSPTLKEIIEDPFISHLIAYYLSRHPQIVSWRGYAQGPMVPINFRAWGGDFHYDLNSLLAPAPKIMILLNDVREGGQEMQVIKGTNHFHWRAQTYGESKFSFQEALHYGSKKSITKCYGPAGTLILFDSLMLHRGTRSLLSKRDVITISFGANRPERPFLTLKEPLHIPDHLILIEEEQDTDAIETQRLWRENLTTKSFSDLKPRCNSENLNVFRRFLSENYTNDLMCDTDQTLPLEEDSVRHGSVHLVLRIREGHFQESLRIKELFLESDIEEKYLGPYQEERLLNYVNDIKGQSEAYFLTLEEFVSALSKSQEPQKIRTHLIYLIELVNIGKGQSLKELINFYASYVYQDDKKWAEQKKNAN